MELLEWAASHGRTVGRGWATELSDDQPRKFEFRETRVFEGHEARVWAISAQTTADDRRVLATASADQTARIWDMNTGACIARLEGHDGIVRSVAWTPDIRDGEHLIATASADGTARIWDITGRCQHTITDHTDMVSAVVWLRRDDRLQLVTAAFDGAVRIWSSDGDALQTLRPTRFPQAVGWVPTPDGIRLAIGDHPGDVQIIDPDTEAVVHRLDGHPAPVDALAVEPAATGCHRFVTGAEDGSVRIWDSVTGRSLHRVDGHAGPVWGLAWADETLDQSIIATAGGDGMVRVWDADTGECLAVVRHPDEVNAVAFVTGETLQLLTACDDSRVRLWTAERSLAARPPARSAPSMPSIAFRPRHVLPGHTGAVMRAALTEAPGGRLMLATASADRTVRVWDADAGRLERTMSHAGEVADVVWVHDRYGRLELSSVTLAGQLTTWDPMTGRRTSGQEIGPQWSIARIRDGNGRELLAASGDGIDVQVWDLSSGQRVQALQDRSTSANDAYAMAVAWIQDGGRLLLAVGDAAGSTRVWDSRTGALILTVAGHSDYVTSVGWARSQAGTLLLATASADGTTRIWHGGTGRPLHILRGHTADVRWLRCAQLPNGRPIAATASIDGMVKVWDLESQMPFASVEHLGGISGVDIWLDRRGQLVLAAACADGTVRVWETTDTLSSRAFPDSEIETGAPGQLAPKAAAWAILRDRRPLAVAEAVLLGAAGVWQPLGLTSDLVMLTGTEGCTELFDPRLSVLAEHPGIRLLRALGWPAAARASFAALLSSAQPVERRFRPPVDSSPQTQLAALARLAALAPTLAEPTVRHVESLVSAADQISPGTVTLLRLIGSSAAAADPLLVVRLSYRVPELPELTAAQNNILALTSNPARLDRRVSGGSTVRSTGTAGVTRRGSPTSLLLTELALPDEIFDPRYAANELLYRHHPAGSRTHLDPVTIVLDTTPPTFGPAEGALRLVAHLVTKVLWERDVRPLLVTLTKPQEVRELAQPTDLLELWTSRTLDPPDLTTAWSAATKASSNPTVTLTMHHRALSDPTRQARLVTSHQPGWPPRRLPSNANHHHISPEPTLAELTTVLTAVLSAEQVRR